MVKRNGLETVRRETDGLALLGKRADLGLRQMHKIHAPYAHTIAVRAGAEN